MIRENLQTIYNQIGQTSLIGVTKFRTIEEINSFLEFSHEKIIGENYVQEYALKKTDLQPHTSHLIGKLQSNKVKIAVSIFDVIETVDSVRLANKINDEAGKAHKVQDIMIQVNISNDSKKSGCRPDELNSLINEIVLLKNINLIGLMTILLDIDDLNVIYNFYSDMAKLKKEINELFNINISLSMGMSHDYQLAIKAGSDFVRIGTAIFGERK